MSPVPSLDASTTTTWSITPRVRRSTSGSAIPAIVRASLRAGTHTDTVHSRAAAISSGGKWEWWRSGVRLRLLNDHVPHGGVEALLGLLHEAVLEPVALAAGVREQHDLVGIVGHERVLEREQRVLLAGVAGGVDALVVEARDGLLLHRLGTFDRRVRIGQEEALLGV